MSGTLAPCNLLPTMAPTPVLSVATLTTGRVLAQEIDLHCTLNIHTTPYNPITWNAALASSNLLSHFPNLVHDLTYGSPISNPPPLSKFFLPKNLPSANIHPMLIDQELQTEVSAGRMSGPFTIPQASIIFGGPFRSSPVGLVEKIPGDGTWHMIRHLSKCDDDGQSTNDWVDSDDFPTNYFAASWVCQFVSSSVHFMICLVHELDGHGSFDHDGHAALVDDWACCP